MSIRWRHLAGDTAVLAAEITFLDDPDQGVTAQPEMSASWGVFRLWCKGFEPTASVHGGHSVEGVCWYLLPLLEWFGRNWDPMLHEERLPNRVAGDTAAFSLRHSRFAPALATDDQAAEWDRAWSSWWQRHCLQAAREGGIFPELMIRRWRDQVEVSWEATSIAGDRGRSRFAVPVGVVRVDAGSFARALHELLSRATEHLVSRCPGSGRLAALSRTLEQLAKPDPMREDTRLGWLAGLSSDESIARTKWSSVVDIMHNEHPKAAAAALRASDTETLLVKGSCHAGLLFGSTAPSLDEGDVLRLAQALADAWEPSGHLRELDSLVQDVPVERWAQAWEQGYETAEEVREALGFDDTVLPDLPALLSRLGIGLRQLHLSDRTLRGVCISGEGFAPTVVVNRSDAQTPKRERFTCAHELCHLLVDQGRARRLALASGPWAPKDVERRANAFAAAFLMPWAAVQRSVSQLTVSLDSPQGVSAVAHQLDTSFSATLERLHDLGFLDETQRDRLRDEIAPQ